MAANQKLVLTVLICLALLAGAGVLAKRVSVERANRTVAIAVDFNRVQELSGMTGSPVTAVLRRLKSAGASHVAVKEDTLGDLVQEEQISLVDSGNGVTLMPAPEIRDRVLGQLKRRLPGGTVTAQGGFFYPSARTIDLVRLMGLGYPEEAISQAAAAGLRIVARPIGEMAITREAIAASLDAAKAVNADAVIFAGIQVFGVYDLIKYAAEEMQRRDIKFGYLEMSKQFGEDRLAAALKGNLIRCHAIAAEEMIKVAPQRAIDRFNLGVRERNVRLCYVRPYSLGSPDPLADAVQYVATIAQNVRRAGYQTGVPQAFTNTHVSRVALMVLLMGIGAATLWLAQLIFMLPPRTFWWLVGADVILSVLVAGASLNLAQTVGALGAATVFPTLGLLNLLPFEPRGKLSVWRGIGLFCVMSLLSLAGGLLAAACISDLAHMMEIATFRGVKLAEVLPLLLVALVFAARETKSYLAVRTEAGEGLAEWPALKVGIVEAAASTVRYWHVGLIFVGMILAALMLMRSGNVTPVPPSNVELKVRDFLESTLIVRPRTKEIFLGHPAMILALSFGFVGWRRGRWAGMLLGAIGQVSLVNTFAHIHTPLMISLIRVFNGVWLGIVVALFFWVVGGLAVRVCRGRRD